MSRPRNAPHGWTYSMGDGWSVDVYPARSEEERQRTRFGGLYDEDLHGVFPTRLDAVEAALSTLRDQRAALAMQIDRLLRVRGRALHAKKVVG